MAAPGHHRYVLDTNILVAYLRGGPLGKWIDGNYQLRSSGQAPLISIVTEGEIKTLSRRWNWGSRRVQKLDDLLGRFVVVPLATSRLTDAYAEIDDLSRCNGRRMGKNDVWIAATARLAGTPLLTTDKDFDHLNPETISVHWIDPNSGKRSPASGDPT